MAQSEQELFNSTVDNIGDYIWKTYCEPNMENVLRYYRAKVAGAPAGGMITVQVPYEQNTRTVRCSGRAANLSVGDECLVMVFGDASNAICTGKVDLSDTTGGGGGTTVNYEDLSNKPQINNVTLSGNKSLSDLGINVPEAYTSNPEMDGIASAGSSSKYSKGDHVHPTDTTRQAKITASGMLKGDGNGGVSAATAGTDYQAPLPTQSGHSGQYLTTNGSTLSWSTVDALPSQTGNSGKFLTTNGSSASWATLPTEVYYATYDSTTYADIVAAYNAGKDCIVTLPVNSTDVGTVVGELSYKDSDVCVFLGKGDYTGFYFIRVNTNNVWEYAVVTYASTASPAFTGTPTAPTATAGTDNTQIATTAFVQAAISASGELPTQTGHSGEFLTTNGSAASWSALPSDVFVARVGTTTAADIEAAYQAGKVIVAETTIASANNYELRTALYDRVAQNNFVFYFVDNNEISSRTVTGSGWAAKQSWIVYSNKANLVSPAFTGVPTAPTAASGTSTTQIATTAFVQNAIAGGGGMSPEDLMKIVRSSKPVVLSSWNNFVQSSIVTTSGFYVSANNSYVTDPQSITTIPYGNYFFYAKADCNDFAGYSSITVFINPFTKTAYGGYDPELEEALPASIFPDATCATIIDNATLQWAGITEMDTTPTQGSYKPVTSDGIYNAIASAGSPTAVSATLTANAWSSSIGSAGEYGQNVSATGVTASNQIEVALASNVTSAQYLAAANAQLLATAQASNQVTVECFGTKPTIDIPIVVRIF